jgi:hypothetical protein
MAPHGAALDSEIRNRKEFPGRQLKRHYHARFITDPPPATHRGSAEERTGMRRFVLGTDRTTAEQDKAFYNLLRARWPGLGWWHRLSETWLFVDLTDTLTVADLRDAATEAIPGVHIMAIEAKDDPNAWAGFGLKSGPNEMFSWMRESWERRE